MIAKSLLMQHAAHKNVHQKRLHALGFEVRRCAQSVLRDAESRVEALQLAAPSICLKTNPTNGPTEGGDA